MRYLNKKNISFFVLALLILYSNIAQSQPQSGWYQLNSGTSANLNSASFVNEFTGFMVGKSSGNGIGIKTTNGGFNWLIIPGLPGGTSVKFADANNGFVADGTIYKTTDGGQSWINENLSFIQDLSFVNANTGYGAGEYSTIIKTTNGGANWISQSITYAYYNFKSVSFLDAFTGFAAGGRMLPPYSGSIFKTTDGGLNWRLIDIEAQNIEFRSISFPNSNTGYIVGGDRTQPTGVVFKTTNGGENWIYGGTADRDLNSVYFLNSQTGYIAGGNGLVVKTESGGIFWTPQASNTTNDLNSIYFIQPDVGYTAGTRGDVQKTVNGGTQGPPYTIEGFVTYQGSGLPVQSGRVVAFGYNYTSDQITIIDSASIGTNGYYRLVHIPTGDSTDIMAYPNSEADGFVGGFYPNTIFWVSSTTLYLTHNLTGINISVNQTVNPGGTKSIGGGVFKAVNSSGLSEARVYARIGNNYYNMGTSVTGGAYSIGDMPPGSYELVCDRMGYRSALQNVIINTENLDSINFYLTSINPIGISNQNLYVPTKYSLNQNYPNPFNPATNIRFDIPKESKVRLSVFDVLGREVEVLVDNVLKPGTYKVDWRADKFSSGLYFYRIVTNDYVDVKKMILLK
jgi:photosystem II stability/assembly factor-like uncharacterized protein